MEGSYNGIFTKRYGMGYAKYQRTTGKNAPSRLASGKSVMKGAIPLGFCSIAPPP
jgi:hypothetical protein